MSCHRRKTPGGYGQPDCESRPSWRHRSRSAPKHKTVITQAFVLAAGLGTRLRPLTDELPKPLVPIFQKPLITFALDHLIATGIQRFVINTHRLPHLFERQFAEKNYRGRPLDLVNEPELLETGGGIKNVERFLREGDFLTYSGDILTDVPLFSLIEEHFRAGNDVTLALRETGFKPSIAFREGRIVDIGERFGIAGDYDFANIAVWGRKIFQRIPQRKISFIPVLLDWIKEGGKIGGIVLNEGKNREIKRLMEYLGLKVARLIRVSFGPFHLGHLPEGAVAEIPAKVWREQLGMAKRKA